MPSWLIGSPSTRRSSGQRERVITYVKLDGEVGIIGNGAGPCDEHTGRRRVRGRRVRRLRPANFLDIGGGASAEVMADGLEIVLADPKVKSVLVNVFEGITACDAVANGIVQAIEMLKAREN